MAKRKLKDKAIELRKNGLSYSQIRNKISVSKSSLSLWLRNHSLSQKHLLYLKQKSGQQRVERHRITMLKKRSLRLNDVYKSVRKKVGHLSKREFFLAGLFLYWGEGSKRNMYELAVSNTDPAMIRFFIKWFDDMNISREKMRATLHVYKDMEAEKYIAIWSKELDLPPSAFTKPFVKKTNLSEITYRTGFQFGTCMLRVYGRDIAEPIHMALRMFQQEMFARVA